MLSVHKALGLITRTQKPPQKQKPKTTSTASISTYGQEFHKDHKKSHLYKMKNTTYIKCKQIFDKLLSDRLVSNGDYNCILKASKGIFFGVIQTMFVHQNKIQMGINGKNNWIFKNI